MGRLLLLPMILFVLAMNAQDNNTNCPTVEKTLQSFCASEGTGNFFYRPAIKHLQASNGGAEIIWYTTATSTDPIDPEYILVDGEVYFADNVVGSCTERPAVEVSIAATPNAGGTTFFTICSNAAPIDLLTIYKSSILGPPMAGGTFFPSLASGTTIFDPTKDRGTQYQYRVGSTNNICPADDSYIYITVIAAPDSGKDTAVNFASTDLPQDLFGKIEGTPVAGGKWSPALISRSGVFDPTFDVPGENTYSVSASNGCTSSTLVTVTITGTDKLVCHKGKTLIVTAAQVAGHLKHGDSLGACSSSATTKEAVSFYPNPGNGVYQISGDSQDIQKINILNSNGLILRTFNASDGGGIDQINISEVKRGVYFAQILTAEGVVTKRLVKN